VTGGCRPQVYQAVDTPCRLLESWFLSPRAGGTVRGRRPVSSIWSRARSRPSALSRWRRETASDVPLPATSLDRPRKLFADPCPHALDLLHQAHCAVRGTGPGPRVPARTWHPNRKRAGNHAAGPHRSGGRPP